MSSRISHIAISSLLGTVMLTESLFAATIIGVQTQSIANNDTIAAGWFQEVNDRIVPFSVNGGNVGIGTATPQTKLDINGAQIIRPGTDGYGLFIPKNTTQPFDANADRFEIQVDNSSPTTFLGNYSDGTATPRDLALVTIGTERMRITGNGNVGIGTSGPVAPLHVPFGALFGVVSIGSNYPGYAPNIYGYESIGLPPWSNLRITFGNDQRLMIQADGKVGIGTVSPQYALDVVGDINVTGGFKVNGVDIGGGGGGGASGVWEQNSGNIYYTGGNVGIGTATPWARFDVNGTIWSNYVGVRPQNNTNEGGEIQLMNADPESGRNGSIYIDNIDQKLRLFRWKDNPNEYTEYAIFEPTKTYFGMQGNVGIGTSNPLDKLSVFGNVATGPRLFIGKNSTENGAALLHFKNISDRAVIRSSIGDTDEGNAPLYFQGINYVFYGAGTAGSGDEEVRITNESDRNEIYFNEGGVGDFSIRNMGNIFSILDRPGTGPAVLSITQGVGSSGGNVGIGTASPTAKLDVAGSIKIADGTQGAGKVLTSDANGLASWQTANAGGTSSQWTTNGSNIAYTGGNVGIGTSTPGAKLDVLGSARIYGNSAFSSNTSSISSYDLAIETGYTNRKLLFGGLGNGYGLQSTELSSGNNIALSLNPFGGNVGIGTANPTTKLTVAAGNMSSSIPAGWGGGIHTFDLYVNGSVGAGTNGGLSAWMNSAGNAYFSGNVGIGTTTPTAKLDVVGDVKVNEITVGRGAGNMYGNTANGYNALYYNTTGDHNTANGSQALSFNTTGRFNTANGSQALSFNTNGYYNTANGVSTLYSNTTGNNNTANGYNALVMNTTGNNNTANGSNALSSNTTGYANTANGIYSLFSNTTGYSNIANGVQALRNNTTGYYNSANGIDSLHSNTTGYGNTANGSFALYTNTTGNYNTAIGYQVNSSSPTTSNQVTIGTNGPTASTYRMFAASWTNASDRRYKEQIEDIPFGLDFILALKPVQYHYKTSTQKQLSIGFIAQDVLETITPYGGIDTYGIVGAMETNDDGTVSRYSLNTTEILPITVKAIQELKKENDELRSRLEKLEKKLLQK